IRPRVLLLDEPLSALDAQIRHSMVEELQRLHRDLPDLTVLYVTHDQAEALVLADRIAILRDGRMSALGRARDLYRRPPNRFAAEFLGRANLFPVRVESVDPRSGIGEVSLGAHRIRVTVPGAFDIRQSCLLCVRPHDLKLEPASNRANSLTGLL